MGSRVGGRTQQLSRCDKRGAVSPCMGSPASGVKVSRRDVKVSWQGVKVTEPCHGGQRPFVLRSDMNVTQYIRTERSFSLRPRRMTSVEVLRDKREGALDGGSPMSPVDFKKWQCPLSLFF